jgi:hypothetical protein
MLALSTWPLYADNMFEPLLVEFSGQAQSTS